MAKTQNRRGGSGAPTLADVARHARVSTATVSRCLNSPERVVQATRARVLAAVDELGYAPNFGAQALAGKRTNTYGAIIPTMENAIFARGLHAFQEELGQHGITLLAASSSYSQALEEQQIRTLVARGADALLLIGQARKPEIYDFLRLHNIPVVSAWVHDDHAPHPTVGFDNREAMKALVGQVLELGHKRFGYISAHLDGNDRAVGRHCGVVEGLQDRGLDPNSLRVIETPYSIENGANAFAEMMEQDPPSVVLCGNDVLAAGALRKAQELGLSVPQDVSITGFDDIEIAQIVSPGLTTVHVPHAEMGRRAAQVLIALKDGGRLVRGHKLQATIRWRNSLGPVPDGR